MISHFIKLELVLIVIFYSIFAHGTWNKIDVNNIIHDTTGKQLDPDPFNELDHEESLKRFMGIIKEIDENKDHLVQKNEMTSWIEKQLRRKDIEVSLERFAEVDSNKDGQFSWQEFVKSTYDLDEKDLNRIMTVEKEENSNLLQNLEYYKKKFNLADLDQNKLLNRSEYKMFLFPEHYLEMAPLEVERTLEDFDLNKDGKIDFREFLVQDTLDNETVNLEMQHFNDHDTNSDGYLQGTEIIKLAIPGIHLFGKPLVSIGNDFVLHSGFEHIAQGESAHLFNETDQDRDGVLTYDEIMKMHGLWTGSPVTNFGDLLHPESKDEL